MCRRRQEGSAGVLSLIHIFYKLRLCPAPELSLCVDRTDQLVLCPGARKQDVYKRQILVRSNGLPKSNWNIEYALRQMVKAYNQLHQLLHQF